MINAKCSKCTFKGNYADSIGLENIKQNPPMSNIPKEKGDCDHKWTITQEMGPVV